MLDNRPNLSHNLLLPFQLQSIIALQLVPN